MTQYKRVHLLLILLMLQLLLNAQPAEAIRHAGFISGEGETLITEAIVACTEGVELGYVNGDLDVENGILELKASIWEEVPLKATRQLVETGTKFVAVPLSIHPGNRAYAPIDAHLEKVSFSASDEIPGSVNGNIHIFWSEFGLNPKVGQWVLVESTAPFLAYEIVKIEECEPGAFPPPASHCANEYMDVTSAKLNLADNSVEYGPGRFEYAETFTITDTDQLLSTVAEVTGRLYPPADNNESRWDPDFPHYYLEEAAFSAYGHVNSQEITSPSVVSLAFNYTSDDVSNNTLPFGLVLYHTYASDSPHVNIFEPTLRYVDSQSEKVVEKIYFYPLAAPTDIKVTGVYFGNLDPARSIIVRTSAGGVEVSRTNVIPNIEGTFNIVELVLEDVPRGTQQLDFTIESPAGNGDDALLTGVVLSYPCLDAVDNVAEIRETRTAPLIDGLVDAAWQSASSYSLKNLLVGNGPLTAADFSVTFRSLYDSNNLYVLIETTDDALYNDSGNRLALDDMVELYLDTNFSQGLTYDNVDDRATYFRWNDPITHKSNQSPALPPGLQKSIVTTTNGYRVELRLPLAEIRLPPTPGYTFGLDVHAHDDDNGGEREHKLAWNSLADETHRNPSLMGTGRLVAAANTLPIANDDAAIVQQNTMLNGTSVLANDSDPDGDPLTVTTTPLSGPSNGSLALNVNGTYVYTPNPGFVGNDSFIYEVSDGKGGRDTATVTITVTSTVQPVNRPPVANDDAATVQQNTTLNGATVLGNDSDPDGDPLTVTVTPISGPSNGSLVLNGNGSYVYTPNPGFVGNDSFVYEVSDGKGGSDTATVTITVTITAQPVNRPPVANDDAATVQQNTTLNGATVLANDSDPDGDPLTVAVTPISGPSNGSLVLNVNGSYIYTPNPGFVGNDSFVYEVSDGRGGSDTATVRITVQQTNRPPVANPDSATTAQNTTLNGPSLLANDSDPDGDLLTINTTPVNGPSNGSLVLNANGTYVYQPTAGFVGTDRFTYAVSDGNGGRSTATVTIDVTVVLGTSSHQYYLPLIGR